MRVSRAGAGHPTRDSEHGTLRRRHASSNHSDSDANTTALRIAMDPESGYFLDELLHQLDDIDW